LDGSIPFSAPSLGLNPVCLSFSPKNVPHIFRQLQNPLNGDCTGEHSRQLKPTLRRTDESSRGLKAHATFKKR
jgi:hypothetical protein